MLSRNTQGVKLINLSKGEFLASVAVVDAEEEMATDEDDDSVVSDGGGDGDGAVIDITNTHLASEDGEKSVHTPETSA